MGHPSAVDMDLLLAVAARSPARATNVLRSLLDELPVGDPEAWRLWLLLGELLHRQGHHDEALNAVTVAIEASAGMNATTPISVLGVRADLALCAGGPNAADACLAYLSAVENAPASAEHFFLAWALRALADFQSQQCLSAQNVMRSLIEEAVVTGHFYAPMLMGALSCMQAQCTGRSQSPRRTLPPFPAGVLSSDPRKPVTDFLSFRVRAQPHRCRGLTAP